MLHSIYIRGLAVIDELSIEFSSQLNVITGETGAGKSILIKALSLILGGKGSPDVVRKGMDQAVVSAVFQLPADHQAFEQLTASGLPMPSEESDLILRRQISTKGRSQAWINDVPVTLSILKSVGIHLIDVFGQHDNHKLLDPQYHSHYLDQFLSQNEIVKRYQKDYQRLSADVRNLRKAIEHYQTKLRDRDYIEFRKAELDQLDPTTENYYESRDFLVNSKAGIAQHEALRCVEDIMDRGFQGKMLAEAFQEIIRHLQKFSDDHFLLEQAHNIEEQLNQYSFEVGKEIGKTDVNERDIELAKDRLNRYHELFHKLNVRDIEGLMANYEQLCSELDFLDSGASEINQNLKLIAQQAESLQKLGTRLSQYRQKAFQRIHRQIKQELTQLNMKGAELTLQMLPWEYKSPSLDASWFTDEQRELWAMVQDVMSQCGPDGMERVQFLLQSNPGDEPKPLSKIASGGEISRIMLGIKKVLSEGAHTCVMVFDEIDTGISGQTANIVGAKLSEISKRFQVICISHLPQVAVYGDCHFKVSKSIVKGRAESKISRMNREQCLEEVARLLSSGEITKSSLQNARDLFKVSQRGLH
ncbi:DNA repair protein RecN [Pseudobacteriovorax antillogorgiicola]|uniref:DNA repair protein RecN n=1 Tax=Pseudobacteriovorax antillogorgiicola TaxID=1513793 RepID=A0A1Y6B8J8_9BACT|nr:DNA repair protein RecN [Pseudobacteriovorax antillogorgiicola]TCS59256.1 DNA replication and repair protein RecN [Pseudobacteriovorax antillogorgiicola]SME89981.1 DNA repair protein RecN (Recombination protein N) [Pseudobacteriovorax antillogorgiicola]